ncbi:recombinase family protein [Flavobacterium sp. UBA6026]|uniref:recombinase family protein n=1 Tax=Flavobacterium sp. UBA6026 TaxID=1946550 RepID=UPI0025C7379D|nr:recombinase family protein [Flavobacterium sp. UBA6026]
MAEILYCRVSSIDQKTDRQRINEKDFKIIIEDKCSGSVPFFEREGGKQVLTYIDKGILTCLSVWTIDRLGRNLRDILNTIHFFNEKNIPIIFVSQGLRTIDENGKENTITKLMISILGTVGEMEKSQIRERQLEGIKIAKLKGVYKGRQEGTFEDVHAFLDKPKNKKALEYIKKGYNLSEAAKLSNLHINTMTKIKKLAFVNNK